MQVLLPRDAFWAVARPPRVPPRQEDLRRAADVLNAAQKVARLVGAGAMGAFDEVVKVAERLGASVAKALLGRAPLPSDLPFVTGSAGWLGTRASITMLVECDTLPMVGSSFPYTEFLPKAGQPRGVQIDIDGRMLACAIRCRRTSSGTSAQTLSALLPLRETNVDRTCWDQIERSIRDWWQEAESQAMHPATPLNSQRVV